ncbi:hypothetical protein ACWGPW_25385 [Paenibacillus chitinolyticus]
MEIPIEKGQEELPFYRTLITALTEHTPVGIYAMENGALTYANDSYDGIENELQHKYLLGENCNDGQGYYFSRPLPADSLAGLLNRP